MKIITWQNKFEESLKNLVGGKTFNLWKYQKLNVPKWLCLTTEFFKECYQTEYPLINKLVKDAHYQDLEKLILSKKLDLEKYSFFKNLNKTLNVKKKLIVRSSAADEDSNEYSFAGGMESFLDVKISELELMIKKCFLSAFSQRAIAYRKINQLKIENIEMAVIIQEMIEADYAGVMNTINPITNNPDEFLISIVEGTGEKLVSGTENSADYFVNGEKITYPALVKPLNQKLILKIASLGYDILKETNHFQDIEFCLKKGKVYLLQTRDITPYQNINIKKARKVLDNSNIVESYSGVTTPLTFSFAKEIYYKLYKQTLEVAKIPPKIIARLDPSLKEMIVCDENRIYYNLNSWYHLNSIFPSSQKSIGYMERMMGVKTKMTGAQNVKLNLFTILKSGTLFIKKIKKMPSLSEKFLKTFDEVVMPYLGNDFKEYSASQVLDIYQLIEEKILGDYTTTIINDSACMIYYGMLTKKVQKKKIADVDGFISEAVGKQGDLASAMSAPCFLKIIEVINNHQEIKNDFLTLEPKQLFPKYHGHPLLKNSIGEYFKLFGSRVPDELKLETMTLYEDPLLLYEMLKNQIVNNNEALRIANTPSFKKVKRGFVLNYLINKTKYFIKNRELLRLKRTYLFSVVRKIFLRLGEIFTLNNYILNKRDIFFLEKQEIFNLARNMKSNCNYFEIVKNRQRSYEENKERPNYERIIYYGTDKLVVENSLNNSGLLQGIPSGGGIVRGYVNYVKELKNIKINQEIIMAYRTDPGWIVLFPMCTGLIVERGSILSHSAVVAREMGIPAVVGIPNVTKIIKDRDEVIVDGIKGEVIVCEEKAK